MRALPLLFAAALFGGAAPAVAEPVLMISIDGLRPGDVIEAEKRGLRIPNLRRFLAEGAHATGVVGVLPTITYPSHTTLLTGTAPAKHGIVGNTTFDPTAINYGGWYWYASDILVPTLWEVASKAGLRTANVHWPVSVGAKGITYNLPQIWRSGHPDDAKLVSALATPGLVARLEASLGAPYAPGMDESITGDETRGRFAARLIADEKPDFVTVYLTALDHEQHGKGPGSPEAHAILERIDTVVGQLIAAERMARPDAVVALVSDHGFEQVSQQLNLYRAFIDEGLVTIGADGKISGWQAVPWSSGGSIAIVLAHPEDKAVEGRVRALLDRLAARADTGIARIIDRAAIAKAGANPQASFYVDLKAGMMAAGFAGATAPLVSPSGSKGMHGFFPGAPAMRSTFMVMGTGISPGMSLGEIDMRAIAPTLARVMKLSLPDAEVPPLDLTAQRRR